MKLLKEPKSAIARCKCCGRIYEMDANEYANTFCKSPAAVNAITASSICLCKHCGVGIFDLLEIKYE